MRFEQLKQQAQGAWAEFASQDRPRVLVGAGTCGRAAGAGRVLELVRAFFQGRDAQAVVCEVGCLGLCYAEPLVELGAPGLPRVLYGNLTAENVPGLLSDYFDRGDLRPDLALAVMDGQGVEGIPPLSEHPMMAGQVRVVLRNCGLIDPTNIDHYIACGGYEGLAKALAMRPEDVIEEVKRSGLRGRGGAGFPTGVKWELCRRARGEPKYLICNADEGDPGAFMDRAVLESDPHSVIEGMAIAAWAIGAAHGYIYVRAEYPLAVERLEQAIAAARSRGLLGDDVLGSGLRFDVRLKKGAGAFVCGEETAMLASIEGRRGIPRPRPPFPAQEGLHGKPTNINNVETLANLPVILTRGSEWFARCGTEKSRGTKTFALAGKVVRTGLIEVPLGIPLQQIVFEIGGGIPGDRRIKAVQTGGPSGGCIPAALLSMPADYEKLTEAGSIMGSGGMVVMDEDTCMVDIARYFVDFTQSESCGKCTPCRLGTRQMLTILNRIASGQGTPADLDLLQEVGEAVKLASLCGLGQTAPNPVLTTLRYFRDEYDAHIRRRKCPAAVCRGIVDAPCKHTCPAGVDVPRYVRLIAQRRYADALDVVRERNPFPSVCAWVCSHPCETRCRRGQLDEPIAVRALKRFIVKHGTRRRKRRTPRAGPTGKRVAVVGAGVAGLTAAYYLGLLGHSVTVFEQHAEPGGMLRVGIPAFRLPRDVIDADIAQIRRAAGVRLRTNSRVSSVEALFRRGYDAVLVSTGAHEALRMEIPGEDLPGVYDSITFLRQANSGAPVQPGRRVAVIGGGNAAMDAARTAVRIGAEKVFIVYRRTRADMPAWEEDIEQAIEEGVEIMFLTLPVRIRQEAGGLVLDCIRMRPGPTDRSGRRRPEPIEGSELELPVDSVIMTIGQKPEDLGALGLEVDGRGQAVADDTTLQSGRAGLFVAGDAVTGPATVVEAISTGRQAAESIDRYLGGSGVTVEVLVPAEEPAQGGMLEEQQERPRVQVPRRPVRERLADGSEVELCYSEEQALQEAERCLRCDLEKAEE